MSERLVRAVRYRYEINDIDWKRRSKLFLFAEFPKKKNFNVIFIILF